MKPERRAALKEAGGKHTSAEIKIIHDLQLGQCIWCDIAFSSEVPSTRDHILPLAYGGSDAALNLVIACRSCNSRRCHTPFRTFCRLLSPAQNVRILEHLVRRIETIDFATLTPEQYRELEIGLRLHDTSEFHYKMMSKMKSFGENLKANKLFPLGIEGIMREAIRRQRAERRRLRNT